MTFPPDGTMLLLMSLWTGEVLLVDGEAILLTLPDGNRAQVPATALDTLEEIGAVEITEHGAVVTEKAGYLLNRWVTHRARQRGHHGCFELKSARVSRAGRV